MSKGVGVHTLSIRMEAVAHSLGIVEAGEEEEELELGGTSWESLHRRHIR
jgi:hypothetical protein